MTYFWYSDIAQSASHKYIEITNAYACDIAYLETVVTPPAQQGKSCEEVGACPTYVTYQCSYDEY